MNDEPIEQQLAGLDDPELLKLLNAVLAARQRPPTEREEREQQEQAEAAEYARYYPDGAKR